jgi:hypothetical protein
VVALDVATALEVTFPTFLVMLFVTVLSTELTFCLSIAAPVLQAETNTKTEKRADILYSLFIIIHKKFKLIEFFVSQL